MAGKDQEPAKYDDEKKVSELVSDDGKFIGMLSSKLDTEMNGWKSLASKLEIKPEISAQFGLPGRGPTAELFFYMSTTDGLKDLTVGELREHFKEMEQKTLATILEQYEEIAAAESPLLEDIGKRLNKNMRAVKNWRNLAYRLKIPHNVYDAFDTFKEVEKGPSPTAMLFKWLKMEKPTLNVKELLNGLREIKRWDVVQLVIEEVVALASLEKTKTEQRNSTQVYLTAKKALHNLEQIRQDTDQAKKKENDLLADLREKAAGRGLTIKDNDEQISDMISALCHQLEIKKGLKYSDDKLKTELVQYHKDHPDLNDFVDQKEYLTWTDYVDKLASNGHWGDGVTVLAAARHFHCVVRVMSNRNFPDVFFRPASNNRDGEKPVELVLGHIFQNHFVSLQPGTALTPVDLT